MYRKTLPKEVRLVTNTGERPSSEAIQHVLRWLLSRESAPFKRRVPQCQAEADKALDAGLYQISCNPAEEGVRAGT